MKLASTKKDRSRPYIDSCQRAAHAYALANPSDPFAYSRTLMELRNQNCAFGLPSDVLEDSVRILGPSKSKALT